MKSESKMHSFKDFHTFNDALCQIKKRGSNSAFIVERSYQFYEMEVVKL